jgi:hypothetical protein
MNQLTGWLHYYEFVGSRKDLCGYVTSGLVLTTFSMTSMRRPRVAAIASNLAFIVYALAAHLHPILVVHCILLPLYVLRFMQIEATLAGALRTRIRLLTTSNPEARPWFGRTGNLVDRRPGYRTGD